ncbi:surfactin synthase thioesterase subunit [Actinoplanes octamycinicus]|uniref:Surfactin synthase thioesterase subunit n=1 Tax=Actinoplanes octamycinicus TaxID=135948 RepID=A0A7W7MD22_9ACTN|nr:alpha/beta fold hydrolase [Actinoplanes octamycinicus]MBB4745786.1 surfactin synthase thioesterase subunit [Actinoplanes octamycinicus]GIE63858.1 thioesterase [Actinoplanes octamycinicus]
MTLSPPVVDTSAWIRCFHPAPSAPARLVCFPHAGGSASYFFPVSRALSPQVEVLGVQYPGRQDRRHEPCVSDLISLAEMIVPQIEPWLDRPVAFFGHSLGASLAYEVARRLPPGTLTGLFVSGRGAPTRVRNEGMHLADDHRLIADLARMSGTDPAVLADEEILRTVLPALRADYQAAETYRYHPGPPLTCPITALIGNLDDQVSEPEARPWADRTTGPFTLRTFPGGHFYLNDHAPEIITLLRTHLAP